MRTVAVCLWQGSDLPDYSACRYDVADVARIRDELDATNPGVRLVVYADAQYYQGVALVPGVDAVPMRGVGCGGWTPMFEPMHPDARDHGRVVQIGLDTIITGDLGWMFEATGSQVMLCPDPHGEPDPCNAAITFDADGAALIWRGYSAVRGPYAPKFAGVPSEMALLRYMHRLHGWSLIEDRPDRLLSYKAHVLNGRDWSEASMVYFHGRPKPRDLSSTHPLRRIGGA